MVQKFRAFSTLAEELSSVLNTYMVAKNICNSILEDLMPSSVGTNHSHDTHTSMYTKHLYTSYTYK